MNASAIAKAIGHAIFKHDLNITDDLFIIHANELDTLCEDATHEIMESQSLTVDRTGKPTDAEIEAGGKALWLFEHQDSYPTKELLHKSFEQAWQLDVVVADYCDRSECLLKAARKAVTQ